MVRLLENGKRLLSNLNYFDILPKRQVSTHFGYEQVEELEKERKGFFDLNFKSLGFSKDCF